MNAEQRFPKGWDERRVQDLIAYYDGLTEDERADEFEAALEEEGTTLMAVPDELVDEVRTLIARKQGV